MPLPCDPAYSSCYGSGNAESPNPYSSPVPAAEPDKTSRLQSLFQGVTGVITSIGDVYQRIKYKPTPADTKLKHPKTTTIPAGSGGFNPQSIFSSLSQNNLLLIGVVVVGSLIAYRMLRK